MNQILRLRSYYTPFRLAASTWIKDNDLVVLRTGDQIEVDRHDTGVSHEGDNYLGAYQGSAASLSSATRALLNVHISPAVLLRFTIHHFKLRKFRWTKINPTLEKYAAGIDIIRYNWL